MPAQPLNRKLWNANRWNRNRNEYSALCIGVLALLLALGLQLEARAEMGPTQDPAQIKGKVQEFLRLQTQGYPGQVGFSVNNVDPNLRLPACAALEAFLPPGSRAWGKTSVGVRCNAPAPWTIYVQSSVSVIAQYAVAAAPLGQGHVISAQDLVFEKGDLAQLPPGIFTDPAQAIGRSVNISLTAGSVLRQEMLRQTPVIQQGQTVMLIYSGKGFRVSSEGQALGKASEGQIVQAKVASGQVVSGVARQGGQVEVSF